VVIDVCAYYWKACGLLFLGLVMIEVVVVGAMVEWQTIEKVMKIEKVSRKKERKRCCFEAIQTLDLD
jgi:hypothetical protein